jgi:hypothetical protein
VSSTTTVKAEEEVFFPKTAAREDRRQANEALGRSFCKTVAEAVTNSDSSAKRKLNISHSSGLVELMLGVPAGQTLDTAALKERLKGKYPVREIRVEVVTSKQHRRPIRELVVLDNAQGMSRSTLKAALDEYGGDKLELSGGVAGRNLFGRGLSDFLKAHTEASVSTFDGHELSTAVGEWVKGKGWSIRLTPTKEFPAPSEFDGTRLSGADSGTVVRCVLNKQKCSIPDDPNIVERLENFYMLRLIAADPNVHLKLTQFRTGPREIENELEFDFPLGQVVASFSESFVPPPGSIVKSPLKVDFLIARSEQKLRGLDSDRDARQNGILIVDDLDAVYDLTFADPDFERAEFLQHIYGVVRINGLRDALVAHLNSPDFPTSPLRVDRDGFNESHDYSRALLDFLADKLRPFYERERKRFEEKDKSQLSSTTKKRIDEALKILNRFFNEITGKSDTGPGPNGTPPPPEPTKSVQFLPETIRLVAGRPRKVKLLLRQDSVKNGAEICASSTSGISVVPETEFVDFEIFPKVQYPEWSTAYLCCEYEVSSEDVGARGSVSALVEGRTGDILEATLSVDKVLEEPTVEVPETMEFRPPISMGRPGRRNNLVLFINTDVVNIGHYIRIRLTKMVGSVHLLDARDEKCDEVDIKLGIQHQLPDQNVARILIPWRGTAWNQNGNVEASTKIGGPKPIVTAAKIKLAEPDDPGGGFFRDAKYTELDGNVPSAFAAGTITVNSRDPLNHDIFGANQEQFDQKVASDAIAQQRLASLLLDEVAFRALEQQRIDDKLHLPNNKEVSSIHQKLDMYKFDLARSVFRALVK